MTSSDDLARRRNLLIAALVALRVKASMPELDMMHRWLDNWTGVGLIATGMERQDSVSI